MSLVEVRPEFGFCGAGYAIGNQQHGGGYRAVADNPVDQGQGVFRELAAAGHDAGFDGFQVLSQNVAIIGEVQHRVGAAGEDHQRGAGTAAQFKQIGDFLLGSLQARRLHITLTHGLRDIEKNDKRGLIAGQG